MSQDYDNISKNSLSLSLAEFADLVRFIEKSGSMDNFKQFCNDKKLYAIFDSSISSEIRKHLMNATSQDEELPGVDDRSNEGGWSRGMRVEPKDT